MNSITSTVRGSFSRSSITSVTWRQRGLFFQTPSTLVLSYNILFHIIPIIHAVPLARARARSFVVVSPTAQRALISGSLVGYPQKTFRKKFLRHFVEPPGQRTRMLSIFFRSSFSLCVSVFLVLTPLLSANRFPSFEAEWGGIKERTVLSRRLIPPSPFPSPFRPFVVSVR